MFQGHRMKAIYICGFRGPNCRNSGLYLVINRVVVAPREGEEARPEQAKSSWPRRKCFAVGQVGGGRACRLPRKETPELVCGHGGQEGTGVRW
jgi:hypothetical protein